MRFGQPGGRDVGSGEHASLSPAALRWSKEVKALEAAQKASSEKSSEYNRRAARGRRLFEDVQIGRGKHREGATPLRSIACRIAEICFGFFGSVKSTMWV